MSKRLENKCSPTCTNVRDAEAPVEAKRERVGESENDLHKEYGLSKLMLGDIRCLKRLSRHCNYLNGLILALVISLLSFHPWVLDMANKALSILPLLLLVLIFVYLVNPVVLFILTQLRRIPRLNHLSYFFSLVTTYVLLLVVVGVLLAVTVPRLVTEMQKLAGTLPGVAATVQERIGSYRHSYFDVLPLAVQDKVTESIGQIGAYVGSVIKSGLVYAGAFSSALAWGVGAVFLVPLISFYLLADGDKIVNSLVCLFPQKRRNALRTVLDEIHAAMQGFLKGQAILCCVIGSVTGLSMGIILPDYCVALGLVAGITEAIPVVGPILGAIPAVFIAMASPNGGVGLVVLVIAVYVVIQQLENTILVPRIMGQSLGLHPLSLMLGMMVFGNMFGFWGVVLSAPIVATVKILVFHLSGAKLNSDSPSGSGENRDMTLGEKCQVEPSVEE